MTIDELIKTEKEKRPLKITIGSAFGQSDYGIVFEACNTSDRIIYALHKEPPAFYSASLDKEQILSLIDLLRSSIDIDAPKQEPKNFEVEKTQP